MAFYRTGTAAVTQGGKTVTGTGTLWSVTVQPGDAFVVTDANGLAVGGIYEVAAVNSNTSLTLYQNYQGTTASGLAYAVLNMAGDQTTASFANRLSQFFDKQQALLNAPGVNVIKVGGVTFTPDAVARTLELVAGAGITLTPSAAGKTVTIAGAQATESAIGSVELATAAEVQAGTDTVRAVTPAGLLAWATAAGLRGIKTESRATSTDWNTLPAEFAAYAGLAPKLVDISVTAANAPFSSSGRYAYVFHFCYISATTSCVQVAIPYLSDYCAIYFRTNYAGTWNAWRKLVDTMDPAMPILSITTTDDATSATSAPLKSAGGLAVAKGAIIGDHARIKGVYVGGLQRTGNAAGSTVTFLFTSSISIPVHGSIRISTYNPEALYDLDIFGATTPDSTRIKYSEIKKVADTQGYVTFGVPTWVSSTSFKIAVTTTAITWNVYLSYNLYVATSANLTVTVS